MKFSKINRWIHREFGYFFVGMTIIYAISGIAINHIADWNPNYIISHNNIKIEPITQKIDEIKAKEILSKYIDEENFKSFYFPQSNILKIFYNGGSLILDVTTGIGYYDSMTRRPIFYEVNKLHYNPNIWWTIFSDIFAVALFLLAITGMFLNKGKYGIKGRGGILVAIGILIPIIFLFFI